MADVDRASIRRTRAGLTRSVRRDAAAAVAAAAAGLAELHEARRVGAYVPVAGEVDPWCLLGRARRSGAEVFLPEIVTTDAGRTLRFAAYEPGAALEPGAFGIPVPSGDVPRCAPAELDLVLVPLVAFDAQGTRAGMGGGNYDRAFARHARGASPLLVGLAYSWQEVPLLRAEPWDVALDAVLTERGLRRFPGAQPR